MQNKVKGYVFDLDGTIVDSGLDFDQMREDLGFPAKAPILEYLATIEDEHIIKKSKEIIFQHELEGARKSTLMHGFEIFFEKIKKSGLPTAILTRNNRDVTKLTLEKFKLEFDIVFTRDDCAAKPNPEGLLKISQIWNISPRQLVYIGDYSFDLETAKNANYLSALYLNQTNQHLAPEADYLIECYTKAPLF